MDKTRKELIVVVILAGILITLIGLRFKKSDLASGKKDLSPGAGANREQTRQEEAKSDVRPAADASLPLPAGDEMLKAQVESMKREWGADPFRNPYLDTIAYSWGGDPGYELTGTSLSGEKAFAILGDNIVSVGSHVDGYGVKEIGRGYVVLQKNGIETIVRIKQEEWFKKIGQAR